MQFRIALISLGVVGWAVLAAPVAAQGWSLVDTEGTGGAGAAVCATAETEGAEPPCFRLTCENDAPLHYEIALFGDAAVGLPEEMAVELRVDGRPSGLLLFQRGTEAEGVTDLAAPFDPRLHGALVAQLRKGNRAELVMQNPAGAIIAPLSLKGSSKALGAVMEACPLPEVPLNDPAAVVLDEVVRACGQLGGSVAMEPGFERDEDLDGDGRDDVVIDYAAAVCSEMASLYCGSGGCTVGFFLARDEGFERIYDGVIRGYSAQPGGLLALDLHGTACGLYGFEACRKVFRISDDSFALVGELSGEAAEAAQAADRVAAGKTTRPPVEAAPPAAPEPEPAARGDTETETPATPEPAATPAPAPAPGDATPERAGAIRQPAPREAPASDAAGAGDAGQETAPAPDLATMADEPAQTAEPIADVVPDETEASEPPATAAPAAEPEDMPAPDAAPVEGKNATAQAEADPGDTPSEAKAMADPDAVAPDGLEWMGDGGSVFIPTEGERLPEDLDPDTPEIAPPGPATAE
jgi:hypothetical protein